MKRKYPELHVPVIGRSGLGRHGARLVLLLMYVPWIRVQQNPQVLETAGDGLEKGGPQGVTELLTLDLSEHLPA